MWPWCCRMRKVRPPPMHWRQKVWPARICSRGVWGNLRGAESVLHPVDNVRRPRRSRRSTHPGHATDSIEFHHFRSTQGDDSAASQRMILTLNWSSTERVCMGKAATVENSHVSGAQVQGHRPNESLAIIFYGFCGPARCTTDHSAKPGADGIYTVAWHVLRLLEATVERRLSMRWQSRGKLEGDFFLAFFGHFWPTPELSMNFQWNSELSMNSVVWHLLCCAHLNLHGNAQVMDIFLREILGKLTGLLKSASFQSHTVECPAIGDSSPAAPPDTAKPAAPNQFEGQLLEALASTTVVRQYQNISYRYEYYLNVDVYGRDGNNQRLEADESPVLMDLASIDNVEFIPTTNITLKAPRRFFRLGVTKVTLNSKFPQFTRVIRIVQLFHIIHVFYKLLFFCPNARHGSFYYYERLLLNFGQLT